MSLLNHINIGKMSVDELRRLNFEVGDAGEEYEFDFEYKNDPRKGIPYAAFLVLGEEGKVERFFIDLDREYGRKEVLVYGTYIAEDGDIVEERHGGSWKNDYRYWFIIWGGERVRVADIDNSREKVKVIKYLTSLSKNSPIFYKWEMNC